MCDIGHHWIIQIKMYNKNVHEILMRIGEEDIVLEIGGWFRPFNRANWVVDVMPYETRGEGGADGGAKEYFSKETWIQRDICARKPLPFKDKEIDFVICSHILEDVRDPVFVCSEICRVGKQGYIEVPSKLAELSLGIRSNKYAGYFHHRWIIEIENKKLNFIFKPHFIHSYWKYHLPSSYGRKLAPEKRTQWFFWEESFEFVEKIDVDYKMFRRKIEDFIRLQRVYSEYRYQIEKLKEPLRKICANFFNNL